MSLTSMSDFVYAMRIITLLSTPWEKQAAYEHGIIDANGKVLRKRSELKTKEEKESYTYLHRLVFNMKRIMQKTVESGLGTTTAATMLLLKESSLNLSPHALKAVEAHLEGSRGIDEETPTNQTGNVVQTNTPSRLGKMVRRKPLEDDEE